MFGHESSECRKKKEVKQKWVPKATQVEDQGWKVVTNNKSKGKMPKKPEPRTSSMTMNISEAPCCSGTDASRARRKDGRVDG